MLVQQQTCLSLEDTDHQNQSETQSQDFKKCEFSSSDSNVRSLSPVTVIADDQSFEQSSLSQNLPQIQQTLPRRHTVDCILSDPAIASADFQSTFAKQSYTIKEDSSVFQTPCLSTACSDNSTIAWGCIRLPEESVAKKLGFDKLRASFESVDNHVKQEVERRPSMSTATSNDAHSLPISTTHSPREDSSGISVQSDQEQTNFCNKENALSSNFNIQANQQNTQESTDSVSCSGQRQERDLERFNASKSQSRPEAKSEVTMAPPATVKKVFGKKKHAVQAYMGAPNQFGQSQYQSRVASKRLEQNACKTNFVQTNFGKNSSHQISQQKSSLNIFNKVLYQQEKKREQRQHAHHNGPTPINNKMLYGIQNHMLCQPEELKVPQSTLSLMLLCKSLTSQASLPMPEINFDQNGFEIKNLEKIVTNPEEEEDSHQFDNKAKSAMISEKRSFWKQLSRNADGKLKLSLINNGQD